jgi:hypothetical protein
MSSLPRMRFAALLTTVALAAFLGGAWNAEAEAKTKGRGGKSKAPAAGTADCKTDSDCVVVLDDCCSCNEGGKQRAIPRKEQATYEKDRRKRCTGTMCTEVMSQDPSCSQRAFCGAGICELGEPPGDSAP